MAPESLRLLVVDDNRSLTVFPTVPAFLFRQHPEQHGLACRVLLCFYLSVYGTRPGQ
jgi:hypothetical protein